jgi:hypothetical protein
MNSVKNISISRLDNGDFYQFIENIVTIVSIEASVASVIEPLAKYQPILFNAYKKEQLTEETKQLVVLDGLRDRAYSKLRYLITAHSFDDENPGFSAAAKKIETFMAQHGNGKLISFDYNKETASISGLINDIRTTAATELNLLQLKPTLDFLELKNNAFKDFYATRGNAASALANVTPFTN